MSDASKGPTENGEVQTHPSVAGVTGLAKLLDGKVRIPGTSRRIGLDAVIGLIPGIGDATTALMSAWIVVRGAMLGVPKDKLLKMSANVAFDTLLGAIPIVGDIFDVLFRSNERNARIVEEHLYGPQKEPSKLKAFLLAAAIVIVAFALFAASAAGVMWLYGWATNSG